MYIMLIPCLAFFVVFSDFPMTGLVLSFKQFTFNGGLYGGPWVGFRYFESYFSVIPRVWCMSKNTLIISSMKLFLALPFPIIFALQINEIKRKRIQKSISRDRLSAAFLLLGRRGRDDSTNIAAGYRIFEPTDQASSAVMAATFY